MPLPSRRGCRQSFLPRDDKPRYVLFPEPVIGTQSSLTTDDSLLRSFHPVGEKERAFFQLHVASLRNVMLLLFVRDHMIEWEEVWIACESVET